MRKLIIFTAGVAVLAAPVCVLSAGFGSLVSSFKSPSAYPGGVSYKPDMLYISAYSGRVVWRTTMTGSVISYHPNGLSHPMGMTVGIIRGVTYYWVVDKNVNYIYRFVDNSSTIAGSFPVPGDYCWGASFVDATHMYYSALLSQAIYILHPMNGSIYSSYSVPFYPGDLAYDPEGYLWVAGPAVTDKRVYKCTTTGSVLASFSAAVWGHPYGCGYDGEYVWIGASDPDHGKYTILQYDVCDNPAVAPASVGRIKALYR